MAVYKNRIGNAIALINLIVCANRFYRMSCYIYREGIATCKLGVKFSIFREALRISIPITFPA